MALELYDRVKETTTTTGTGTLTLAGAVTGFRTFGSVLADADTTYYAVDGGAEWEVGLGTVGSSGTTLARTQVISSSNSNNAVNFSAGTKTVFVTTPAALFSTAVATFLATPSSANLATLLSDDAFSMSDVELGAIAGLTSAANKFPYFTGSGTAALADLSANMRTFLTTPSAANFAAVVSDDTFSLADAELGAIAGLTSAADKFPYFTGAGTAALADLSSAMRTFLTTSSSANFAAVLSDETGSSGGFVRATGPSMAGILYSTSATVSAAGTTQGAGTVLTSDFNVLTTVTGAANAVVLPGAAAGLTVTIVNADSADAAQVFPASGDNIDALSANAAFSLAAGQSATFRAISASQWYSTRIESTAVAALSGTVGVTQGGTGSTTQFTAGSVVFAGASGVYTQDNANFFWDDTNNRLGIGTASPVNPLDVVANANSTLVMSIRNGNTGASAAAVTQWATGTANAYTQFGTFDVGGSPTGGMGAGSGILNFYYDMPTHIFRTAAGSQLAHLSSTGLLMSVPTTSGPINYAADAQASDTYVITLAPVPAAYTQGMPIYFKANTANTGAATLNVNGLGARAIVKGLNTALATNDILAGMICHVVYDLANTNFILMNPRTL